MRLTEALRHEYAGLWASCEIRPECRNSVRNIVAKIMDNAARYQSVGTTTNVPWWLVAVIHRMEAGGNFSTHLHNGDPLTAPTVHVPKGRPLTGEPPFSWEASAADAIRFEKWDTWGVWTVPYTLYRLESYNGMGYRESHRDVLSPYLWSGTLHYTRGKYGRDGVFDPDLVSKQIGAAPILKELELLEEIEFPEGV